MSRKVSGRVTLDDIAEEAGTSKGTVSKALNGKSDVSPEMRDTILAICRRRGYVPKRGIPSVTGPQHIALVSDTFHSLYTLQIIRGAADECAHSDLLLSVTHLEIPEGTSLPRPLSTDWIKLIAQTHVGLVVVTARVTEQIRHDCEIYGLHMVAVDPKSLHTANVLTIGSTNWNGCFDVTNHLLDLGHKRIAFVQGPPESLPSQERLQGYKSALQSRGITVDDSFICGDEFTMEAGFAAGHKLFALDPDKRPTAVVAGAELSAVGVMVAARSYELRVPEDISIAGFDDTSMSSSTSPSLTAVHQPLKEMGAAAIRAIVDLRDGRPPTGPLKLNTQLVIRNSTMPPQ